jgi:hypothetical protein
MASKVKYRKRTFEEPFSIHKIVDGNENWFYYFPKIVGTSRFSNLSGNSIRRDKAIEKFFDYYGGMFSLQENGSIEVSRKKLIQSITDFNSIDGLIFSTYDNIFLVPEPNNPYDPNAISVRIAVPHNYDYGGKIIDVGYLPASHAKEITNKFNRRYVIGAEKDGRGMRVHVILSKIPKMSKGTVYEASAYRSSVESKKVVPGFLSLKNIRKQLEV